MCDFCWLWEANCRFVIDAGWVQAIGTLVALGIAIEIPRRQERQRMVEKAAEQTHARKTQLIEIIALAESMAEVAQTLAGQPNQGQPAAVERAANAVLRMREIKTDQLTAKEYKKFRDLMDEASDLLTYANHGIGGVYAPAYAESFRDYKTDFEAYLRLV